MTMQHGARSHGDPGRGHLRLRVRHWGKVREFDQSSVEAGQSHGASRCQSEKPTEPIQKAKGANSSTMITTMSQSSQSWSPTSTANPGSTEGGVNCVLQRPMA